mgnify:CR=1 FL=1
MKEEMRKKKLTSLSKKMKKRMYFSILLALFTLGVNIFAWFAFSAQAGLELDATVASWDVEFKDENEQVLSRNIVVEVTDMKPGMDDFNKTIEIESNSDVQATFSYELDSFSLLGVDVDLSNETNPFDYLRDFYPFSIIASADKNTLSYQDTVTFQLDIIWPYDSITPLYYGQDESYSYNDTFSYYTKSGSNYNLATVANVTAYNTQKNNLYLEKDDADSYFGMMCDLYESETGAPCLVLNMRLLVEQLNN